jgi:uncharacterized membrane protein YuzA (DUF378 family)
VAPPITLLFIPVVATLDVVVWYLRGRAFPIPCAYPTTKRGYCTRMVVGEWHRCLKDHSRWWRRKTDRHMVNPTLRRWETIKRGKVVENDEIQGRGFLGMRSQRPTLLYYRGFARPSSDILRTAVVRDYLHRAADRWVGIKRALSVSVGASERRITTSAVLPNVIRATRLTLALVLLGLGLVIASLAVPSWIGVVLEYCATYSIIIAFAATRTGIWDADTGWQGRSSVIATKGIVGLTLIATLGGLIGLYGHDVVDAVKTIVGTAFSAFTLLIVGCLAYVVSSNSQTRQKRKRRRRRR